jgi:metal-responsive CopG/Arc/MetJ family transcriptional regulator
MAPLKSTKPNEGGSPAICVRLGVGLLKRIDRCADWKGTTRSGIIREALEPYLLEAEAEARAFRAALAMGLDP